MKRRTTPEEDALWRRVVRGVSPIGRGGDRGVDRSLRPTPAHAMPGNKAAPLPARAVNKTRPHLPDPFTSGDPRADRSVRRGRTPIDATFDLHGHTQVTARAALYGFLLEARARGHRCVLVITGKSGGPDRVGRGVLRQKFKEWLAEDAFRQHIIRASNADRRHGGGGAFYVFLKTAGGK